MKCMGYVFSIENRKDFVVSIFFTHKFVCRRVCTDRENFLYASSLGGVWALLNNDKIRFGGINVIEFLVAVRESAACGNLRTIAERG